MQSLAAPTNAHNLEENFMRSMLLWIIGIPIPIIILVGLFSHF